MTKKRAAWVTPEDITKDNAADVLRVYLAATAMMDDMDNLTRCLMEAIRIAIEELEGTNER